MRPLGVVAPDPGIELCLGGLEVGEGPPGEELRAERAVEPLDLACRHWAAGAVNR
jgi:hypothetical protein